MTYTHEGKVDLIYIDPPYNTGARAWIYNDRFVDGNDRYRHSKWLAFMKRRLELARRLLKSSGAILISIDDNEQAHLRLLLDQVFGSDNFVETLAIEISTTSGPKVVNAQQGTIVKNVEFVHIYRKSDQFDRIAHTPLYDGVSYWDSHYSLWLEDDGVLGQLTARLAEDAPVAADMARLGLLGGRGFSIRDMDNLLAGSPAANDFVLANLDRIVRTDRAPVAVTGVEAQSGKYSRVQAGGREYLLTATGAGQLQQVVPLSFNYRLSDDYRPRFGRTVIRGDLWKGFHQDMGNVAKEGDVAFSNGKKPVRLIKQLLRWANNDPDAVVLDYFAGSGTTAHAVMEMNAADDGRRQAILITNNEVSAESAASLAKDGHASGDPEWEAQGVFRKVTWPRIQTVVTGKTPTGSQYSDGLAENVQMFELTFEDPDLIQLGRRFEAIAPLLWLKAGATGAIISKLESDLGWALPDDARYGVLFDVAKAKGFVEAVNARTNQLWRVFIVTDHESTYQSVLQKLPIRPGVLDATRLYADYLDSFRLNGWG